MHTSTARLPRMCGATSQVIGPLFQLLDTNAAASASVPGFDAGVFKSLTVPNPPVRAPPSATRSAFLISSHPRVQVVGLVGGQQHLQGSMLARTTATSPTVLHAIRAWCPRGLLCSIPVLQPLV